MGNGEAKELKCMTHGHELRDGGVPGGSRGTRQRRAKGKKGDKYNSIINKIYLIKKEKKICVCSCVNLKD